jgi:hypothetical protein
LQQAPTGFTRENALVLRLEPTHSDDLGHYHPRLIAFYGELLRRVKALPGVR